MATSITLAKTSANFYYEADDATSALNAQVSAISAKGVVGGIVLAPSVGLTITIPDFYAIAYDGMVVTASGLADLDVVANDTNWIVLYAQHVVGGDPVLRVMSLTNAAYTGHVAPNYLVVLGKVVLGSAATTVSVSDIDYTDSDFVDRLGRLQWRDSVDLVTDLPASNNLLGDVRLVRNLSAMYEWTSVGWSALGSGGAASGGAWQFLSDDLEQLALQGHGLTSGPEGGSDSTYSEDIALSDGLATEDFGYSAFSARIGRHWFSVPAGTLTLTAKPVTGTRNDLVVLEVWREKITTDISSQTLLDSDGSTTHTLVNAESTLASGASSTFEIPEMGAMMDGTTEYRLRWQWVTSTGHTSAMADLYDSASATMVTSRGGGTFAPSTANPGIWISADGSADNADGYTWALPWFLVTRHSSEVGPILISDTDGLWVRFVGPRTKSLSSKAKDGNLTEGAISAAGWRGLDDLSAPSANTISFNAEEIDIRGYRLLIQTTLTAELDAPPATGTDLQLVVARFRECLYPDSTIQISTGESYAYWPQFRAPTYVDIDLVSESVGSASSDSAQRDVAMAAAGWSQVSGTPGLWSRALASDLCAGVDTVEYGTPVCIVKRRNTSAWDPSTNRAGSTGRPDGLIDATVVSTDYGEVLDLRHTLVSDIAPIARTAESQIRRGALRSKMVRSPVSTDQFGTEILVTAEITAGAGTAGMTQLVAVPDNRRMVWSDAEERFVANSSFLYGSSIVDDLVNWTTGSPGTLIITAPSGSVIEWDGARPLFATGHAVGSTFAAPFVTDSSSPVVGQVASQVGVWSIVSSDADGEPTSVSCQFTPGVGDTLTVSVWCRQKRRSSAVGFSDNGGPLSSQGFLPLNVFDVEINSQQQHHGPMVIDVVKTVSGTSFTITNAEVSAAVASRYGFSPTGTTIQGLDPNEILSELGGSMYLRVAGEPRYSYQITNVELDPALNVVTFTVGAVLASHVVTVGIAWTSTSHTSWVEVSRPNRVEGIMSWSQIAWGSTGASDYWMSCPDKSVFRPPSGEELPFYQLWQRPGAGNWILDVVSGTTVWTTTGANSGTFGINYTAGAPAPGVELMVTACVQRPVAPAGDDVVIHYQAVPYQGVVDSVAVQVDTFGSCLYVGNATTSTAGFGLQTWGYPTSDGLASRGSSYELNTLVPYKAYASRLRRLESELGAQSIWLPNPAIDTYGESGDTDRSVGNSWELVGGEIGWGTGPVLSSGHTAVAPLSPTNGYVTGHGVTAPLPAEGVDVAWPIDWSAGTIAQYDAEVVFGSTGYAVHAGPGEGTTLVSSQGNIWPLGPEQPDWAWQDLVDRSPQKVASGTWSYGLPDVDSALHNSVPWIVKGRDDYLFMYISCTINPDPSVGVGDFGGIYDAYNLPGNPILVE